MIKTLMVFPFFLLCLHLPAGVSALVPSLLYDVQVESGVYPKTPRTGIPYDLFIPIRNGGAPEGPFPLVVITHGFARNRSYHRDTADSLARRGMAVLTWNMTGLLGGGQAQLRNISNLNELTSWIAHRSTSPGDPIEGIINKARIGYAGHSAGGAVSFEAALAAQSASLPVAALILLDAVPWKRTLSRASGLSPLDMASFRSEPSPCNAGGNVLDLLKRLPFPTEDVRILGGTHCDPENPTDRLCELACGRSDSRVRTYYQRLMYLFFRDSLRAPVVDEFQTTYRDEIDLLMNLKAIEVIPIPGQPSLTE